MSGVLQEHYGYIADSNRNGRFREAIAQAVRPGDVVVDLGCGFGILGLMCLRAGAARVWGIDRTDAIEIARESAARAGFGEQYHCVREHSFRAELPEQADVLICDHVGFFGLDYGIIAMLSDARRRFLKPGGTVIPASIALKLAGVSSNACRGKAEQWADPAVPSEFHWLRDHHINSKHPHAFAAADVKTEVGDLLTVNLGEDSSDSLRAEVDLVATGDGSLDGFGGWFESVLVPGVTMTNSPLAGEKIEREQVFFPFERGLNVVAGDIIRATIQVRHDVGIIAWTGHNLRTGERRVHSTWRGQILSEADLVPANARIPKLSPAGVAARVVTDYVDGRRSAREIEDAVARDHPDLMPSEAEVRSFVRSELARVAG